MTIIEDAVFSLTDFLDSPGEVIFFPRLKIDGEWVRRPEVWQRGDYGLLSHAELKEQMDIYLQALEGAKKYFANKPITLEEGTSEPEAPTNNQPWLF